MENEKYIVTIDGPDCTGKSTLWKQANELNKNIQIRGIVSNIAYAIKYNRDVNALLELYNQNPVNYVVYLLNPNNGIRLEMLYNRIKNNMIYDNEKIVKELEDASKTWNDYDYFQKALEILKEKYKGKIEVIISHDNNLNEFYDELKTYELYDIPSDFSNPAIKILNTTIDTFEEEAKKASAFKYIVFINKLDKQEIIDELYNKLDDIHKDMFSTLMEYGTDGAEDIYDCLSEHTVEALTDFLDDYEFRCDVNIRCSIDTNMDCYIPLKDFCEDNDRCLEDYIYNNLMDEVYDAADDAVRYTDNFEIDVERVS